MARPDPSPSAARVRDAFADLLAAFEEHASARRERLFDQLYREHENYEREQRGLPPLEPPPYDSLDRENDVHFLRVTLRGFREGPGWTSPEALAILSQWEDETLESLSTSNGKETR